MKIVSLFLIGSILVVFVSLMALSITKRLNPFSSTLLNITAPSAIADGAEAMSPPDSTVIGEQNPSVEVTAMKDIDKMTPQPILSETTIGVVLFDFDGNGPSWYTVNDGVMGGVSTSLVSTDPGTQRLTFSGNLSLENNGGFASIRSQKEVHDLSAFDGIALRVHGDGNIYRFRILTEETGSEIAYTALFKTKNDSWQDIYISFSEMIPIYRGFVVSELGSINPASIRSFGLMLADKQQGEFLLEVDWISAVAANKNDLKDTNFGSG